jgi:hypothetical protein
LSNYKKKISADILPLLDNSALTLEKADKEEEVEDLSDEFDSSDSDFEFFFVFTEISCKKELDYLSV